MDNYQKLRESKHRSESKDKLSRILKKKIETTMIGALSTIEQHFGFLWNNESNELTAQQAEMKSLYNTVRSEILDKGNNQARNIDVELSNYNIESVRYSIKIPVIQPPLQ